MAELIACAKSQPGRINYGSSGPGSIAHLSAEVMAAMAGVKMTHVPYKGVAAYTSAEIGSASGSPTGLEVICRRCPLRAPLIGGRRLLVAAWRRGQVPDALHRAPVQHEHQTFQTVDHACITEHETGANPVRRTGAIREQRSSRHVQAGR